MTSEHDDDVEFLFLVLFNFSGKKKSRDSIGMLHLFESGAMSELELHS